MPQRRRAMPPDRDKHMRTAFRLVIHRSIMSSYWLISYVLQSVHCALSPSRLLPNSFLLESPRHRMILSQSRCKFALSSVLLYHKIKRPDIVSNLLFFLTFDRKPEFNTHFFKKVNFYSTKLKSKMNLP